MPGHRPCYWYDHATICRELRRKRNAEFLSCEAISGELCPATYDLNPLQKMVIQQSTLIKEKLPATWPPEQIVECLRQEGQSVVCFKTIIRRQYSGRLVKGIPYCASHKGKRQKTAETRVKFALGMTISQRPKEVRSRETFGIGRPI